MIRNSVKAIILNENKILLTKNKDNSGIFYLLPGGGQKSGEDMKVALKREVKEETGIEITIGDIIYVREYIGKNHEFFDHDVDAHQIEYMFLCKLKKLIQTKVIVPDPMQIGVEWREIKNLNTIRIYPKILKKLITTTGLNRDQIYLGDIN